MRLNSTLLLCSLVALPASAAAHGGEPSASLSHVLLTGWTPDPATAVPIAIATAWYALGVSRTVQENKLEAISPNRVLAFVAGIGVLLIALQSPIDTVSEDLFSVHMCQHLLLMLAAPPLLVWSRPVLVWLWALPLAGRRRIGSFWNGTPALHATHAFLMRPLVVWLLASAALWLWHLPGPYDWALKNEAVHAIEHACFFLTSLAFWTLVAQPYSRRQAGHGIALIMVATFALHNGLLGALLTFSGTPLYGAYTETVFGLSPLEDQQLAGLIMWVPAGLAHLATLSLLFMGWLSEQEAYAGRTAAAGRE